MLSIPFYVIIVTIDYDKGGVTMLDIAMSISFGDKLKQLREARGLTQNRLAELSGVERSYITLLESRERKGRISLETAVALARALQIPVEDLCSGDMIDLPRKTPGDIMQELELSLAAMELIKIPLHGTVPAGTPFPEEQETGEYVDVPKEFLKDVPNPQKVYGLKVSGDSLMGDGILPGFTVVIEPNIDIIDGKIYVVRLGNEVCIRHVFKKDDHLRLKSSNGKYQDLSVKDIEILGRVVASGRWQKH